MTSSPAGVRGPFLSAEKAAEVRERFGTPCYVYDRATLEATARRLLDFQAPYGFTLRYAMKSNPSRGILGVFRALGLHIDASSDWEVERALRAGFAPEQILLTSQMPSRRIAEHAARGVLLNACSLHQLEAFGRAAPGRPVAVRLNPGRDVDAPRMHRAHAMRHVFRRQPAGQQRPVLTGTVVVLYDSVDLEAQRPVKRDRALVRR